MANRPDKRQQFRFWYPFWGSASASAPASRPPGAPTRPSPTNQSSRTQQSAAPPADKRTPRTPSLSPSPSSSSSSSSPHATSSLPAKQSQPKRVSHTPSSSQPSPTQSPSRRSPRSEQAKQKTKEESTQGSRPSPPMSPATPSQSHSPSKGDDKSPAETSNQPKESQEEKAINTDEPIETKANDSKTVGANSGSNVEKPITSPTLDVENENNGSKDLEKKIEAKSIHFDPLTSGMPTETGIRDVENPPKADEQDGLKKTQVSSDANTANKDSETRPEEKKQAHDETHQEKSSTDTNHQKIDMTAPADQDDNSKETIKEIAKPTPDGSPKETMKEVAQTTDVANLGSHHKNKNATTDDNKYPDNKPDPTARENPVTSNPKKKEKMVAGTGSDNLGSTRNSFQKNIKDGISKLVQKISSNGGALNPGSERGAGASIITLAGENKGASMYIGHENEGHTGNIAGRGHKLNDSSSSTAAATLSKGKEKIGIAKEGEDDEKDSKIAANVNSNVQSINNSMLHESSCDTRDPGVHLRFSSHLKRPKMMKKMSEGGN